MRFLRSRLDLSLQKMADELGVKRGKLAAYEDSADARPEFYQLLTDKYQLNLNKFLLIEMNHDNYKSFFNQPNASNQEDLIDMEPDRQQDDLNAHEPAEEYRKVNLIELFNQIRQEDNKAKREILVNRALVMTSQLEDQLNKALVDKNEILTESIRVMKKIAKL